MVKIFSAQFFIHKICVLYVCVYVKIHTYSIYVCVFLVLEFVSVFHF